MRAGRRGVGVPELGSVGLNVLWCWAPERALNHIIFSERGQCFDRAVAFCRRVALPNG